MHIHNYTLRTLSYVPNGTKFTLPRNGEIVSGVCVKFKSEYASDEIACSIKSYNCDHPTKLTRFDNKLNLWKLHLDNTCINLFTFYGATDICINFLELDLDKYIETIYVDHIKSAAAHTSKELNYLPVFIKCSFFSNDKIIDLLEIDKLSKNDIAYISNIIIRYPENTVKFKLTANGHDCMDTFIDENLMAYYKEIYGSNQFLIGDRFHDEIKNKDIKNLVIVYQNNDNEIKKTI
jgi:hypothetical protein